MSLTDGGETQVTGAAPATPVPRNAAEVTPPPTARSAAAREIRLTKRGEEPSWGERRRVEKGNEAENNGGSFNGN